jgi:hypothetical protein
VWVRAHISLTRQALRQLHRPQVVEEYERAHHVPLPVGQNPAYLEASEAAPSLVDQSEARCHLDATPVSA